MLKLIENTMHFVEDLSKSVVKKSKSWGDLYIEECLNSRDVDPFDSEWVKTDKEIQKLISIEKNVANRISKLENSVFISIIKNTGSSDLAGYISEDFELIAQGLMSAYSSEFFFSIINTYIKGKIPDNSMEIIKLNPTMLY